MDDFVGSKAALLYEGKLVMFLRDDRPGLRFANLWDFPGGGRENNETPTECLLREVDEEFSIKLGPNQIVWEKEYPAVHDPSLKGHFFVANVTKEQIDKIKFGEEGQKWGLVSVEDFFSRDDIVPHFKGRLQDYLDSVE